MDIVYKTKLGKAYCGDSLDLLDSLEGHSINLIMTSPPFALLRKKEYGNEDQKKYIQWLARFAEKAKRVLSEDGSFVLDLGGAYQRGRPIRSLYNYRVLLKFVDDLEYNLAEEFFWYNPSKLPSPIEWVNKRKMRAKDSVNTVWWFSKSDFPKANVSNVLVPYSDRMKKLIEDPEKFFKGKKRPSGHDVSTKSFGKNNGGAIPSNMLSFPNTESNSCYLARCKELKIKPHPARFPQKLPEFFIKFLTGPGDTVLDIFSGSNTTGEVAERLGRKWLSCDLDRDYVNASSLRFIGNQYDLVFSQIQKSQKQHYIRESNNRISSKKRQLNLFI